MILYPNIYLTNVKDITLELLNKNNIKGLLLDVDNTLIDFDLKILEGSKEWINELKENNIKLCILSNTNKIEKVKMVAKELDIPYINFAKKPFKKGFKRGAELLNLKPKQIAVVGDQIMTDVLRWKSNEDVYNSYKAIRQKRYIYYKSKKAFRKYNNKRIFKKARKKAGEERCILMIYIYYITFYLY